MKYPTVTALRCATFALAALVNLTTAAQQAPTGNRAGPPEQAIAACKSLQAGSECSFTATRGNVTGTCFAPQGKPLACRPKDAPETRQTQSSKP